MTEKEPDLTILPLDQQEVFKVLAQVNWKTYVNEAYSHSEGFAWRREVANIIVKHFGQIVRNDKGN